VGAFYNGMGGVQAQLWVRPRAKLGERIDEATALAYDAAG